MNILFKINQRLLTIFFTLLVIVILIFLYFQFRINEKQQSIDYDLKEGIVNPKFIKEKKNKDRLKVEADQASFVTKDKIFLEGAVKYFSDKFILESDKVNFNQMSFNASSNEKTTFKSEKLSIASEGFNIKDKGNIITFNGKSKIEIK